MKKRNEESKQMWLVIRLHFSKMLACSLRLSLEKYLRKKNLKEVNRNGRGSAVEHLGLEAK